MSVDSLQKLFEHELEDIYFAEQELLDALEEMANHVEHDEIGQALSDHRETTQGHIDRLEQVFDDMGMAPETEECEGIEGLLKEHEEFASGDPSPDVHDVFDLTAAQKTEHYEIAAYGNLALIADRLGMDDAAKALHDNLEEEEQFLERLKRLTDEYDYQSIAAR